MKFVFIKQYNPAYDVILTRYLQKGGVVVNEHETKWERERELRTLRRKNGKTPYEDLYMWYLEGWSHHPENKPATYNLVRRLIPPDKAEFEGLKELESQLLLGEGKLVLSSEEVAEEVSEFYGNYVAKPLQRDISEGADDQKLSKYFDVKEGARSQRYGMEFGVERKHEEDKRMALELLTWLAKINTKSVLDDLDGLLQTTFKAPEHVSADRRNHNSSAWVRACEHRSEYVWLACRRKSRESEFLMVLRPIRGMSLAEFWDQEVQFPEYYVKRTEAQ